MRRDEAGDVGADPVLARRRRVGRLATRARRAGFALYGLAIAVFVAGVVVGLSGFIAVVVVASLVVGSALLLPAIVVGFGVSAADREDRRARP